MTARSVAHHTFSLERSYGIPPARVFAAWSTPQTKQRWFAPGSEHRLDFQVGGAEVNSHRSADGSLLTFESRYHEIVADERIVYTSVLSNEKTPATVSITTVEFRPDGDGTLLLLTESDAFLDGQELPAWREQGTASWLDALGAELATVTNP
jgi:uncharacterized protein YndB with AHSA1/START domain